MAKESTKRVKKQLGEITDPTKQPEPEPTAPTTGEKGTNEAPANSGANSDELPEGHEKIDTGANGTGYMPGMEKIGVKELVNCVLDREKAKEMHKKATENLTGLNSTLQMLCKKHETAFTEDEKGNLVYDDGDIEITIIRDEKITSKVKKSTGSVETTETAAGAGKAKKKVTVNDIY